MKFVEPYLDRLPKVDFNSFEEEWEEEDRVYELTGWLMDVGTIRIKTIGKGIRAPLSYYCEHLRTGKTFEIPATRGKALLEIKNNLKKMSLRYGPWWKRLLWRLYKRESPVERDLVMYPDMEEIKRGIKVKEIKLSPIKVETITRYVWVKSDGRRYEILYRNETKERSDYPDSWMKPEYVRMHVIKPYLDSLPKINYDALMENFEWRKGDKIYDIITYSGDIGNMHVAKIAKGYGGLFFFTEKTWVDDIISGVQIFSLMDVEEKIRERKAEKMNMKRYSFFAKDDMRARLMNLEGMIMERFVLEKSDGKRYEILS